MKNCLRVNEHIRNIELATLPFMLFWPISVLSKPLQLGLFGIFALALLKRYGFERRINKFEICQIIFMSIYLLAIIFSLIRFDHETSRIFATFNTFTINCLGLLCFHVYRSTKIEETDRNKICMYSFVNLMIFVILAVVFRFTDVMNSITIFNHGIGGGDLIYGKYVNRFFGYQDYANAIVFAVLLFYPFAIRFLNEHKILAGVFSMLVILPVAFANSRSGVALYVVILLVYFAIGQSSTQFRFFMNNKYKIIIVCVLVGSVIVVLNHYLIAELTEKIMQMRSTSNNSRMLVYTESIRQLLNNSPVIGMGIKDLIGEGLPYGSHSTYLGAFYKAGIAGGIAYMAAIFMAILNVIKSKTNDRFMFMQKISMVTVLALMLIEDIDGTNWSIIIFFIVMADFFRRDCEENPERKNQVF